MAAELVPVEIHALAKIVDELNYYQMLHLKPDASASDIKHAFHASSRTFHPDVNRHLDGELQRGCARISKRLTEAYCVLRDPRRRRSYDSKLAVGDNGPLRMQLAEAKAEDSKRVLEERQGRTPQGRQFFQKASHDLQRGNYSGAAAGLQMALTFEPDNALFKQKLEEAKQAAKS